MLQHPQPTSPRAHDGCEDPSIGSQGEADEGLAVKGRRPKARHRHRGMSLLEIMVVITLIGLVTAAVGVSVMAALQDGQIDTARSQAFEIGKAVDTYKLRRGRYPSNAEGLTSLTQNASGRAVIERLPIDPWGRGYSYVQPGQKNPRSVDIISAGPDGQLGTDDDVGNWHES